MKKSIRATFVTAAMCAGLTATSVGGAGAINIGTEGCTPGYWKNHTESWEEYEPSFLVRWIFNPNTQPIGQLPAEVNAVLNTMTFEQALQGGGGKGFDGAIRILLRATVASYLNAAHEGVGYPYRRFKDDQFDIEQRVFDALATKDRQTMLDLAAVLDAANNLGCPLD